MVGVIGPNGAGKTTLFNVISGLVRPSSGSLTFQDKDFRPIPERLTRVGISRTLQAVGLFPRMTALENVMVGAARTRRTGFAGALFATLGADRDERRIRAESMDWLARLGVADSAGKVAATLPYGVQKKVALARALVSRSDVAVAGRARGRARARRPRAAWRADPVAARPTSTIPAPSCLSSITWTSS